MKGFLKRGIEQPPAFKTKILTCLPQVRICIYGLYVLHRHNLFGGAKDTHAIFANAGIANI